MFDMHTHTNYSDDSHSEMEDLIIHGLEKGLSGIAITDHYDPDYPAGPYSFIPDFPSYHRDLLHCSKLYKDRILVMKGLEAGIQNGEIPVKLKEAVSSFPYDFVIGSFHTCFGRDLYQDYFLGKDIENAYHDFYKYMMECLLEFDDFDVLGHINVADRYAPYIPDEALFLDDIEEILTLLINKGKGMEINTSCFKYKLEGVTIPTERVLKLYRKKGGEILTTGSDSHTLEGVGFKLDWALEFAKNAGFKYTAHYINRKPIFTKIP